MKTLLLLSLLVFSLEKEGFATRYWDCCKPSCSWPDKGKARQCDAKMNVLSDPNAASKCDGGPSTTCLSQIPKAVNDNLAYAFAASPGGGPNVCGQCFELTFTGLGKYETQENHRRLKGKKMIVMSSNIGYDVAGGQFDIMIPGGGVGLFNGCSGIFNGNMGATYGGLLSDCENQSGWDGNVYQARKSCLSEKCRTVFSNQPLAVEGCLFLANWMEAAGNPLHNYEPVACPSDLASRY